MVVRSFFINLSIVFVTLLVLSLIGEFVVRFSQHYGYLEYYGKHSKKQKNEQVEKVQVPKVIYSTNSKLFVEIDPTGPLVNALGMRGPLRTIKKPKGVFRIVVLGDSVAYGYGVKDEETFSRLLEVSLNAQGKNVEVINLAVCGYGLEAYTEVYRLKARQFNPDLVLLAYVLNDLAPTNAVVGSIANQIKRNAKLRRIGKFSQFAAWLADNYEKAIESYENTKSFNEKYFNPEYRNVLDGNLKILHDETSSDSVPLVVFVFPYLHDMKNYPLLAVHAVIKEALLKTGISFHDLLEDFRSYDVLSFRIDPHDITHPNVEGHRVAAEAMEAYLKQANFF